VVWSARTLAGTEALASEWKYVPVRRLALFLEGSVSRGIQWAVFEPNEEQLWRQLRLTIGAFLESLYRQGALQGRSTREAFFVKCDQETTTQDDIDRGVVNVDVGFAPLKPAEFVVLRIQQKAGQVATREGTDAKAEPASQRLEDLVLPRAALDALHQIVAHLRHQGPFHHHRGIGALFCGGDRTGKTLAAEALAGVLERELYRVDLSTLVSRYIGETERNLGRVFETAEESGAILLLDEAEALLGAPTGMRDAHDRYANSDVDVLLQRIEAYRGLAILTTNHRADLDAAFLRRLHFVVEFPFPVGRPP